MSETKWAVEVSAYRKSGLSAAAYSREHELSVSSLRYWSKKLKGRNSKPLRKAVETEAGTRMTRVRRFGSRATASPAESGQSAHLRLVVGPVAVEVSRGFDAATLGRLLDVLEGGR